MRLRKSLSVQFVVFALVAGCVGATAFAATSRQQQCAPGTSNSDYCANNANSDDPPPSTPPAVQPPESGQAPEVAGTLSGGTQTLEVSSSSNEPGTADVQVNLAGAGTLIVKAGDQTI